MTMKVHEKEITLEDVYNEILKLKKVIRETREEIKETLNLAKSLTKSKIDSNFSEPIVRPTKTFDSPNSCIGYVSKYFGKPKDTDVDLTIHPSCARNRKRKFSIW